MLNRRLLRIKGMQTVYALSQSEISNYYNSIESISEAFLPDLNSMQPQDLAQLQKDKETAIAIFEKNFSNDRAAFTDESEKIVKAVKEAMHLCKTSLEKDRRYFKKLMLDEIDHLYDRYLRILILLIGLADYALEEEASKSSKLLQENVNHLNEGRLVKNQIVENVRNNKELDGHRIRKNLHWDKDSIRILYKALQQDEIYLNYLKTAFGSFEADKEIVLYIFKSIVFKDKTLKIKFEEEDLNWVENKSIVKSMVVKTIKAIESKDRNFSLLKISNNWEEDRLFFEELFTNYIAQDKELETLLSEKSKNWDVERIAIIDKIIIKLAVCEMMNFPSIPLKVTINEYIELSKIYSTPKSKQFVNGVLDKIAEDLSKKGKIKKSGRGLIDNK